jgi:hypothetical protein
MGCGVKIMESKERTFYSLIILFFVIGLVIGYMMHQPGTEIRYINNTEVPKEVPKVVETIVEVSPTSATPAPTSTPVPDFEVNIFDPEKDRPTQSIELVNWKAIPDHVSMHPGETVLIKVVNYPDNQEKPKFIMGSFNQTLGTAGMIVIKFNTKGDYDYNVMIPNNDPSINPVTYARGSIKIY